MSKPRSRSKRTKPHVEPLASASRAADFVTVGWLLSAFTTLLCVLVALVTGFGGIIWPGQAGLEILSGLMLFAGLVIGIISVVLLVIVLRTRSEPPPRSLIAATALLAMVPPILLSLRAARLL